MPNKYAIIAAWLFCVVCMLVAAWSQDEQNKEFDSRKEDDFDDTVSF